MRDNLIRFVLLAGLASIWLLPLMRFSEAAPALNIPAGSSATLGSESGPTPDTPQGKILHNALTSDTRATLQAAMDSAGAGN
jgi:hypothetical protein